MNQLVKSIWASRKLVATWTRYNIQAQYIETKLGLLWIILQPLLMTLVSSMVFSFILDRRPRGGVPYIIFFLSGNILWQLFNGGISNSTHLIVKAANLIAQIKFPREALVFVLIFEKTVDFLVTLPILLVFNLANGYYPTIHYLYTFPLFLVLFLITLGCMFIISTLGLFIRDIPQVAGLLLRLLFYFSGIIFPADMLPKELLSYLKYNPVFFVVESFRGILFYKEIPDPAQLFIWLVFGFFVFIGGIVFFKSKEGTFADYQ